MVNKKKNYLCESGIEKSVPRGHRFGDPRDRLVMSIGDPLSLSHTQDRFLLHVHEKKSLFQEYQAQRLRQLL